MDLATAANIARVFFTIFFFVSLVVAWRQFRAFERNRKFQEILTIFKELQLQELINVRKYIYDKVPEIIEGIDKEQLKIHIQKSELGVQDTNTNQLEKFRNERFQGATNER